MQNQETVGERTFLDQIPAFSMPAEEASTFPGTTTKFVSNLSGRDKENASLAQYLGLESCLQGPQQEASQNREDSMPSDVWVGPAHELRALEDNDGVSQGPCLVRLPQGDSTHCWEPEALFATLPQPTALSFTLENVGSGSRGREAECVMECFEAGDQETCYDTMDLPAGEAVDKYLPQEICPMDLELTEGQSKVRDLCSPDKTLAVLQTQGSESPQSTYECSKDRTSSLFNSTFTWNASQEASEDAVGETPADAGNSPSLVSSTVPCNSGGPGETQPLCSETNSFVNVNEGGTSVLMAVDTLASYGPISGCPKEQSMESASNVEYHQVTGETEGTLTDATEVHRLKCHAVSAPEDSSLIDGAAQASCEAQDEDDFQSLSDIQLGHPLSSSTSEVTRETLVPAPSSPGAHDHFSLPEGHSLGSSSLHADNQAEYKSQSVEGAHSGDLREDFQERGSGTKQCAQPRSTSHQGSLSANDFQEILPSISAMQQETNAEPFDHSLADSREETGCGSDPRTEVSGVEGDSRLVSSVPSLPDVLLGEKDDVGLGSWAMGSKVKIITLEAPVFETWPPEQVTSSGYREAEVGLTAPGRGWALPDILRAGAARPERGTLGVVAWVPSPQADTIRALAANRCTCAGDAPERQTHCSSLSYQCLGQPRLLESSVDPVEEKELGVTDSPLEGYKTGEMASVEITNEEQGENQRKLHHPAFVNQFVNFTRILESSVDPINDRGEMECVWSEKPEPSDFNTEGKESTDRNMCLRVDVQPATLQVPHPQVSSEIIPNDDTISQNHADGEQADAKQSQPNEAKVEAKAKCPGEERQRIPSVCSVNQTLVGSKGSLGEAGQRRKDKAESISPMSPPSSCLAGMTHTSVEVDSNICTGHVCGGSEPRNHQDGVHPWKEKRTIENLCEKHVPSSDDLEETPCAPSPEGNVTRLSLSHDIEELKSEELQMAETKPLNSSDSPTVTVAFISGECESEKAPESLLLKDLCPKGSALDIGKKSREEQQKHRAVHTSKAPGALSATAGSEEGKKKQEALGSGHLAAGVKKKILSRVAALRLRLEERENVRKNSIMRKMPKFEKSLSHTDEKKDPKKVPCKAEGKGEPLLLLALSKGLGMKLLCPFESLSAQGTIRWVWMPRLWSSVPWSSNLSRQDSMVSLFECRFLSTTAVYDGGLGVSSRICTCTQFPGGLAG